MCYPNSVLVHARLRGLTAEQVQILADAPGLTCTDVEDGAVRTRMEFAHDIPSWPDLDELQDRVRAMLGELVPAETIVDVCAGCRYVSTGGECPAELALHRLRSALTASERDLDATEMSALLDRIAADFTVVDTWMSSGGTAPTDWGRRHPEGDERVFRQLGRGEHLLVG